MPPKPLIDPSRIDWNRTVAGIETIQRYNPQRFEFALLSRVVHEVYDLAVPTGEVAGVHDVPEEPFWARGHVPGRPLMPGVLMVEAAAQLASYGIGHIYDPSEHPGRFFGFAGLEDVKFRGTVRPGQQLRLLGKGHDIRPRRAAFATQAYVEDALVLEALIVGMWV
jgi:3-hydroxyacyl-[acyl-carrier-protein] dehydratase